MFSLCIMWATVIHKMERRKICRKFFLFIIGKLCFETNDQIRYDGKSKWKGGCPACFTTFCQASLPSV